MLQSQVRALEALLVHCGVENAPGAILVHGRPDIRERLQGDVFIQKLGTRWASMPSSPFSDTDQATVHSGWKRSGMPAESLNRTRRRNW